MDEDNSDHSSDNEEGEVDVIYLPDVEWYNFMHNESHAEHVDQSVQDLFKQSFTYHTESVFIGALSKNGLLAATGGEDDMAYVWSIKDTEIVLKCTGHKDSVTQVAFNFNDQYLATGDMDGLIQVWNLNEKKLVWSFEGDDLEWLIWHPLANVLICGTETGSIFVWQIPEGYCKSLPSYGDSSTCAKILPDGKNLLAGYGNGQVRLWDLKSESVLWQLTTNIPTEGITSLDVNDDASIFVVAPTSQVFKVADGHQIASYLVENEKEIEVVVFNSESDLLATGALSGKFCIWDYRKHSLRYEIKLESSITTIKWAPRDTVIIGCTNGYIHVYNAKSGSLINVFTEHTDDVLSITVSKDGTFFLSTSDDRTANLFSIKSE